MRAASAGYRIWLTRLDLPEPLTPVTATKRPSGNPTSMLRRLFSRAPRTVSQPPDPFRRRRGHRHRAIAAEVVGGDRTLVAEQLIQRAGMDELAPVLPRSGPDVQDPVRRTDRLLVVLHDDQRVAEVSKPHERRDQPVVVPLVQPDRRLIEDVEHAHQARADLGRQPDSLRLASGECAARAVEGEVVEPHVDEEAEPGADLLEDLARDLVLARTQPLRQLARTRPAHRSPRVGVVSMMFRSATVTASDSGFRRIPLQVGHGRVVM